MTALTQLMDWVEARLPVRATFERHLSKHPVPKYVNFWYVFGALAMVTLIVQIGSGVWLMMFFTASAEDAFASVEYIMRDVEYGWLLRYLHSTGASAFFLVVYLHMFRALMYGSYQKPRELVWLLGCAIYVLMMAEGFLGYVLPWGNMSYWAAQVIVSLFGAIPLVGEDLVTWVRGDYLISGITLNRFFALHVVVVPLLLIAVVLVHVMALHEVGAGNPQGIEIEDDLDEQGVPRDGIPFFPYKVLNACVALGIFLILFLAVVFFEPTFFGYFIEKDNYFPANPLSTPEHIVPCLVLHAFLCDAARCNLSAARPGRQVLGSSRDGRCHHHSVLCALARCFKVKVLSLSRQSLQTSVSTLCRVLPRVGVSRRGTADRRP